MDTLPTWDAVADAPTAVVADAIRVGGLAQIKAPRVQAVLRELRGRLGGFDLSFLGGMPLEEAKAWLRELPGVGPKTVGCVLMFSMGMPALPVDTHVYRVAQRLGLYGPSTTPDQSHDVLESMVAPEERLPFHMYLITHGPKGVQGVAPRVRGMRARRALPFQHTERREAAARDGTAAKGRAEGAGVGGEGRWARRRLGSSTSRDTEGSSWPGCWRAIPRSSWPRSRRSNAGRRLPDVFPHLAPIDIAITEELDGSVDFVFSALDHKASAERCLPYIHGGIPVVDLSADFRLKSAAEYTRWYEAEHPEPELLDSAVYGLTELHREELRSSTLVANPGLLSDERDPGAGPGGQGRRHRRRYHRRQQIGGLRGRPVPEAHHALLRGQRERFRLRARRPPALPGDRPGAGDHQPRPRPLDHIRAAPHPDDPRHPELLLRPPQQRRTRRRRRGQGGDHGGSTGTSTGMSLL